MKGPSKRFVNHKGKAYDVGTKKRRSTNIGFLDLWRYSTRIERVVTLIGVLSSWGSSFAVLAAVIIYGELTALFVSRHKAEETPGHALLLSLFNGGRILPAGNRSLHMDALLEDSIAFACASCAVIAFQLAVSATAVGLANWAAGNMIKRLRWRLLRSVISQEIGFFDTNTSMNFASALTEDMEKLKAGVGEHVVMTSYLVGTVIFGACLALSYGWELTLAGLAVVPAAVLVQHVCAKFQTRCSSKEVKSYSTAGRIVEGALANIRTVRAYGGEELEVKKYVEAFEPATKQVRRRGLWAGVGTGLGWFLTYCINATVLAYGAWLCVGDLNLPSDEKRYHPGVLVTVLFITFMAAQNTAMCNPHLEVISNARGAAKSLFKLLERKSQIDPMSTKGLKPQSFRGDIAFNNIYFNYPSRPDVKILRGISLSVQAGDTVALVGSSGCGKSTLLQLLQRMYEPESGSISVDGHRLAELNLHHFRSHIGVVGQEPVLFSGTIRDNITLGLNDVTEEQLVAAAQLAHAHQFITKLADGYDTMLGERGAQLSGGQKQRIAIARAVVRNPKILLLDEPTSALDPAAERLVQAALDEASVGRTTLVVSHRLSTIVSASRIVYIEQGVVLEEGTHLELLDKKGSYWKLVQEDMTNKSIATAMAAAAEEDDDEVGGWQGPPALQRSPSHMSFTRESLVRSSRRRGAGAAHVATVATPDIVDYVEPSVEDASEDQPPQVSNFKLLKLNGPEWHLLVGGGIAAFMIGTIMPFFAVLFSKLYGMFASDDGEEILVQSRIYSGLFAFVAALCGIITFSQTWLFNRAGAKLTDRLREMTFRTFLKQEQGWFDQEKNSVGALCARLASDCAAVQGATGTRLGTVLQGISTMVIGIGLSMAYSWKMTLASLVSVPCVIGGIYLEGLVMRHTENKEKKSLEQASRIATEAVMNVRTVQSLGIESVVLHRYSSSLNEASKQARAVHYVRGPVYGLCLCAPTLGYGVSLAYGGYLIAREGLRYEYAILVSEALIYGAWMLAEALSFAPSFAAARRAGARIVAALERKPLIVTEDTASHDPNWSATGAVNFSSVNFHYPTRPNVPVLKDLSLDLAPGQTVALVGASGCGKSTMLQLLMRGYDLDSGRAELDGRDIKRDLTLPQLRAQLGLVQQEPALFERTIRENIAYGDNSREVAMEEIIRAAEQANVHGFIASLPMGYDTRLGQGGAALSGGQKQRIAIARALVRNPRVLLLDEATSALDANSEKVVQAALEEASKERTTIIIAHRLATVQHAHKICVIDKGKVAESGSHEELVKKRGLYFDLLQSQGPTS